ncbi:thioredoxin [Candidatus Woesearchaeota archaeon]|nr:thioredoxin [Candidatus Woesearchaeota archaeon]
MVTEVNASNFEKEVANEKMPVLMDFWAPWCGPCQMMGPVFAELSKEFTNKIKFVKINADENRELGAKYGVRGIPCFILVNDSEEVERFVGSQSMEDMRRKLDIALTKINM